MDQGQTLSDLIARLEAEGYEFNLGPLARMDIAAATRKVFAVIDQPWPGPLRDVDAALVRLEEAVVVIETAEEGGGESETVLQLNGETLQLGGEPLTLGA